MFAPASWLSSLNRAYRALLEREEGKEDGDRHVVVELRAAAELLAICDVYLRIFVLKLITVHSTFVVQLELHMLH